MEYPLAYFITWTTYGTWLHGDSRGSFLERTYLSPDPHLECWSRAQMTGEAVYLNSRGFADESWGQRTQTMVDRKGKHCRPRR